MNHWINILIYWIKKVLLWLKEHINWIVNGILLCLFIYAFDVNRGIFWLAITVFLLWILWKAWQGRDMIVGVKHQVETAIWGKPLKLFTRDELNNTKVKIVWGKSKNDKNKYRTNKKN